MNAFIPVRGFHRILVWLLVSPDYCANVPIVNQKGKMLPGRNWNDDINLTLPLGVSTNDRTAGSSRKSSP